MCSHKKVHDIDLSTMCTMLICNIDIKYIFIYEYMLLSVAPYHNKGWSCFNHMSAPFVQGRQMCFSYRNTAVPEGPQRKSRISWLGARRLFCMNLITFPGYRRVGAVFSLKRCDLLISFQMNR